jgi:hypothetical protein
MPVASAPQLLVELLSEAARTPGGQVGLLRAGQVAEILGRHRDWVHAHAVTLGGFQLPGSSEWRFAPRGVAHGLLGIEDARGAAAPRPGESDATRQTGSRRLAYPPARQVLADRPRRRRTDRQGASDAPSEQRDD